MDLSYTQNLEDYHLSLAFAGQATGRYIDIGAGHPIADNVSFWFYERGWQGIAVEPQADLVALYPRLRPRDVVVQSLVGRASGEADFHAVDRLHGFSTTVEQHARQARQFGAEMVFGRAIGLGARGQQQVITLAGGRQVTSDAVVIGIGVQYRRLSAPGLEELLGAGVFYGASLSEAP